LLLLSKNRFDGAKGVINFFWGRFFDIDKIQRNTISPPLFLSNTMLEILLSRLGFEEERIQRLGF